MVGHKPPTLRIKIVSIPDGRLVPTLPLRLNYLLWIEDLVTLFTDKCKKNIIVGVDIGCGSACVYPLLAAKKFGWCMVGTESDEINYNSAQNNVKHNSLNKFIIVKNVTENIIFKGIIDDENVINDITFSKDELLQKQNSCTSEDAKQQCSDVSGTG
ncbi:Methyltransferase-like protein 16 [Halocaridina rubra]|uniref:Methyltransferase-like protein 16 n=1 Tax=Halocaridina rubra TaxID=373956 RepID=A0AAN8ZZ72_HALRR